ncbi:MAG: acyl carrier protein [Bryobacteraceae bacterium]
MSAEETEPSRREAPATEAIYAYLRRVAGERLELAPGVLENLRPNAPLDEGLQLDSLAQVTLLAAIEEDLGVALEPEDRGRMESIDDLVRIIAEKCAGRNVLGKT